MAELPSGTVTFLFTDIEGSTELVRRLRDRYHDVLADHQRIVRDGVAEAGGTEIDTQGDSFFFVFPRARNAVLAAANAQRALAAHEWPDDGAVRVRMGIHTGEAAAVDGHYVGVAVHRAARISAIAHGGQVLLSQTSRSLLEDEEELPLDLKDLGEQRLKDFDRPVRVSQLEIPGLQVRFPPLRTGEQREPRLPRLPAGRRRMPILVAAVLLAAGAVAAVLALTLGGGGGAGVAPNSVAVIDAKQNSVVGDVRLGSIPVALAAGEGGIWAINRDEKTLTEIDPKSHQVVKTLGLAGVPSDVAVWVLHSSSAQQTTPGAADARVTRVDPASYLTETLDPQINFDDVTFEDPIAAGDGVWVSSTGTGPGSRGEVVRIDATPRHATRRFALIRPALGLASSGSTWAAGEAGLTRLDPESNPLLAVDGAASAGSEGRTFPYSVAIADRRVWGLGALTGKQSSTLWTVDPGTNAVRSRTIRPGAGALAAGAGGVWVTIPSDGAVWKIDPDSLAVLAKIELRARLTDLAVLGNSVWVGVA